jgi:hypothetical protein
MLPLLMLLLVLLLLLLLLQALRLPQWSPLGQRLGVWLGQLEQLEQLGRTLSNRTTALVTYKMQQ